MHTDVVALRLFYASALGQIAARSVGAAIARLWPDARGERLVGLGYCLPWLEPYREQAERVLAMMPARQGAVEWPISGPSASVLVFDEQLPLADASVDRILMVHLLEQAESAADCLSEAWRVLTPGGRLLIVVPNRRGLWARFEHTPFGTGRPFSKGQLAEFLRDALLTPTQWTAALDFPPISRYGVLRFSRGIERLAARLWPGFAGVLIVEATKRLYQGVPAPGRSARRVLVPVLAPQGAARLCRRKDSPCA